MNYDTEPAAKSPRIQALIDDLYKKLPEIEADCNTSGRADSWKHYKEAKRLPGVPGIFFRVAGGRV